MRIPSIIREYALAVTIALAAGLFAGGAVGVNLISHDTYAPVEMRHIKFLTAQPYHVGQEITILNGVCNTSNDLLQVTTVVGFKEADKDTLVARKLVITPKTDPQGTLGVQPLPEPMKPGCVGIKDGNSEPITGPLPAALGPGRWSLYVLMTIDGPNGKQQKLSETSETITVVP